MTPTDDRLNEMRSRRDALMDNIIHMEVDFMVAPNVRFSRDHIREARTQVLELDRLIRVLRQEEWRHRYPHIPPPDGV